MRIRQKLKLLVIFLLSGISVWGQDVPLPQPGTYVNDIASVLQPQDVIVINQAIRVAEDKYNVQIAVLFIDTLPTGMDIADYARIIGRKWHVGEQKRGLVYICAIQDHKQRLEIAENLEDQITDVVAASILDHMKSYLHDQQYANAVAILVGDVEKNLLLPKQMVSPSDKEGDNWIWVWIVAGMSFIVMIIYFIVHKKEKPREITEADVQDMYDSPSFPGFRRIPKAYDTGEFSHTGPVIHNNIVVVDPIYDPGLPYIRPNRHDNDDSFYSDQNQTYSPPAPDQNHTPAGLDTYSGSTDTGQQNYGDWGGSGGQDSSPSFDSSSSGFDGGGASSDF